MVDDVRPGDAEIRPAVQHQRGDCTERLDMQVRAGMGDQLVGTPTFFVRVKKRWVSTSDPSVVAGLLTP